MTKPQIDKLLTEGALPDDSGRPECITTHISWVLAGDRFVYKIKKPVRYSFLDFSTPEKRKYYCEREVALNRRLTGNLYLDVLPVREAAGRFFIGGTEGKIIDYTVKMRKLDPHRQMDVLLRNGEVTPSEIRRLAEKIAGFHSASAIIEEKDLTSFQRNFGDLEEEKEYLESHLQAGSAGLIDRAVRLSAVFLEKHLDLLESRLKAGYFRDCHGDLHAANIFLLPEPQPFDCIEFNDAYRQIDVLDEAAFLCMDLEAYGRKDLAELFLRCYNDRFPAMETAADRRLFTYYKAYRANIRAKVSSLRAQDADSEAAGRAALAETGRYLRLMEGYLSSLA